MFHSGPEVLSEFSIKIFPAVHTEMKYNSEVEEF